MKPKIIDMYYKILSDFKNNQKLSKVNDEVINDTLSVTTMNDYTIKINDGSHNVEPYQANEFTPYQNNDSTRYMPDDYAQFVPLSTSPSIEQNINKTFTADQSVDKAFMVEQSNRSINSLSKQFNLINPTNEIINEKTNNISEESSYSELADLEPKK